MSRGLAVGAEMGEATTAFERNVIFIARVLLDYCSFRHSR